VIGCGSRDSAQLSRRGGGGLGWIWLGGLGGFIRRLEAGRGFWGWVWGCVCDERVLGWMAWFDRSIDSEKWEICINGDL
jgi:hypothetical protein